MAGATTQPKDSSAVVEAGLVVAAATMTHLHLTHQDHHLAQRRQLHAALTIPAPLVLASGPVRPLVEQQVTRPVITWVGVTKTVLGSGSEIARENGNGSTNERCATLAEEEDHGSVVVVAVAMAVEMLEARALLPSLDPAQQGMRVPGSVARVGVEANAI